MFLLRNVSKAVVINKHLTSWYPFTLIDTELSEGDEIIVIADFE